MMTIASPAARDRNDGILNYHSYINDYLNYL